MSGAGKFRFRFKEGSGGSGWSGAGGSGVRFKEGFGIMRKVPGGLVPGLLQAWCKVRAKAPRFWEVLEILNGLVRSGVPARFGRVWVIQEQVETQGKQKDPEQKVEPEAQETHIMHMKCTCPNRTGHNSMQRRQPATVRFNRMHRAALESGSVPVWRWPEQGSGVRGFGGLSG